MLIITITELHYRIYYIHPPGTYTSVTYARVYLTIDIHVHVQNGTCRDKQTTCEKQFITYAYINVIYSYTTPHALLSEACVTNVLQLMLTCRDNRQTPHMFDIFIRHTWMPCTFVAKTHNHIMDGGIMWYTVQKWLRICTSNFILINHSTHTVPSATSSWQISWWFTHSHIQTQCSQKQSALPSSRYSVKLWEFLSQMAHK
jgi:hypothetical protein